MPRASSVGTQTDPVSRQVIADVSSSRCDYSRRACSHALMNNLRCMFFICTQMLGFCKRRTRCHLCEMRDTCFSCALSRMLETRSLSHAVLLLKVLQYGAPGECA